MHRARICVPAVLLTCIAASASHAAPAAPVGVDAGVHDGADAGADKKKVRMVVTDFDVAGIPDRTARIVADNLVVELRKLQGVSVVGMSEVRAMIAAESDRQIVGCAESSCLAEVADALGADILIAGRIAVLDDATVLSLRRIDQTKAQVVGAVEERLAGAGGSALLAAVGPSVEKLFPDLHIKPGTTRGVPKEIALVLNPPPLPTWSTVAVGGSAVGVAVLAGVFGVLATQTAASAQQLVDRSAVAPEKGATVVQQVQAAQSLATASNAAWVATGGLVVGGGVMALFTDWMGYGNAAAVQ